MSQSIKECSNLAPLWPLLLSPHFAPLKLRHHSKNYVCRTLFLFHQDQYISPPFKLHHLYFPLNIFIYWWCPIAYKLLFDWGYSGFCMSGGTTVECSIQLKLHCFLETLANTERYSSDVKNKTKQNKKNPQTHVKKGNIFMWIHTNITT